MERQIKRTILGTLLVSTISVTEDHLASDHYIFISLFSLFQTYKAKRCINMQLFTQKSLHACHRPLQILFILLLTHRYRRHLHLTAVHHLITDIPTQFWTANIS